MSDIVPWGIHRIGDIYHCDVQAECHGRWVSAVAVPYPSNLHERIRAAWWVLSGKAHALSWPKHGELEDIWKREQRWPVRAGAGPFVQSRS